MTPQQASELYAKLKSEIAQMKAASDEYLQTPDELEELEHERGYNSALNGLTLFINSQEKVVKQERLASILHHLEQARDLCFDSDDNSIDSALVNAIMDAIDKHYALTHHKA